MVTYSSVQYGACMCEAQRRCSASYRTSLTEQRNAGPLVKPSRPSYQGRVPSAAFGLCFSPMTEDDASVDAVSLPARHETTLRQQASTEQPEGSAFIGPAFDKAHVGFQDDQELYGESLTEKVPEVVEIFENETIACCLLGEAPLRYIMELGG